MKKKTKNKVANKGKVSNNKQTRDKVYKYTILMLILIIFILIYFMNIGKIKHYYGDPTGNVDIYDITVPENPIRDLPIYNPIEPPSNNNNNNNEQQPSDQGEDNDEIGKIYVDDKNGDYVYQTKLKVFENPAYEYTNKIAPGSHNTYQFIVHNSSEIDLMYKTTMFEETEYKVNLKYRLKTNGTYILGSDNHWVTANELVTSLTRLNAGASDNYTLDWRWFDDDYNDTIAGKNMTSLYKLKVDFYFEAIE